MKTKIYIGIFTILLILILFVSNGEVGMNKGLMGFTEGWSGDGHILVLEYKGREYLVNTKGGIIMVPNK